MTLGATFPELGSCTAAEARPGPNPEPRRTDLREESCRAAGGGAGSRGGAERWSGADRWLRSARPPGEGEAPGAGTRALPRGWRRGRPSPRPTSLLGPPRSSPTKGRPAAGRTGRSRRRGQPPARTKLWSRLVARDRRGGAAAAGRGLSPAGTEDRGVLGSGAPFFWVIPGDRKLVFGQLGACVRAPGLHLDCFCFWRNYGAGRLHKTGAFPIGCQFFFFFFIGSCLVLHVSFKTKQNTPPHKKKPKQTNPHSSTKLPVAHTPAIATIQTRSEEPWAARDAARAGSAACGRAGKLVRSWSLSLGFWDRSPEGMGRGLGGGSTLLRLFRPGSRSQLKPTFACAFLGSSVLPPGAGEGSAEARRGLRREGPRNP